ncbi:hypothetical protein K7432_015138 [Basidiobolus ranarum]|uniref:PAS domain-containing protein n=1 Tax=Basidiobolus ranarum TaxID=34480 RepID=A0ABR2WGI0_9FUNG
MRKSSNAGATFFDILNNDEILDEKTGRDFSEPYETNDSTKRTRLYRHCKIFLICFVWFSITITVGCQLFRYSLRLDQNQIQGRLGVNCRQNINILQVSMSQLINRLESHVHFVSSIKQNMTYEMFSTFSAYNTIDDLDYAIAWHPQVRQNEREAWEEINHMQITSVHTTMNGTQLLLSQNQSIYYPRLYGIAYSYNHLGVDILQADYTGTVQKALGTLKTAVSPLTEFHLLSTKGIRIYLPVLSDPNITDKGDYNEVKKNNTLLHENILGLISLNIKIDSLLKNASRISEGNNIRIVDKTDGEYTIFVSDESTEINNELNIQEETLPFGDREWGILCYSSRVKYLPGKIQSFLFFAIILCILFSTILLFVLAKKYYSAKELIFRGSKMLEDSNALVADMATNSKAILLSITDPLLLFDRDGKITGANTYALAKTGYTSEDVRTSEDLYIGDVINITQRPNDVSCLVIEPGMREVTITYSHWI